MNKIKLATLPETCTLREVALLLRVSPLTMRRAIKRGDIKAFSISERGDKRIFRDEVLKFLQIRGSDDWKDHWLHNPDAIRERRRMVAKNLG